MWHQQVCRGKQRRDKGIYVELDFQRTQCCQQILPREEEHNLGETAIMAGALQAVGYEHEVRECWSSLGSMNS